MCDMVNSAACSVRNGARCFLVPPECAPPKSCHRQDVADRRAGKPSAGSSSRNNSTVERCSITSRGSKRTIKRGFGVSLQAYKVKCASGTRVRMPSRELLVKFDGLAL